MSSPDQQVYVLLSAVVVGWMASFPRQLRRHLRNTIGHTKIVPGLYRLLDYPDIASLAMPRALQVINGSKDVVALILAYSAGRWGDRFWQGLVGNLWGFT